MRGRSTPSPIPLAVTGWRALQGEVHGSPRDLLSPLRSESLALEVSEMDTRTDRLTENKSIRAWAGTVEDLRQLGQIIEDEFSTDREREISEFRKEVRFKRAWRRLARRSTEQFDIPLNTYGRVTLTATDDHNESSTGALDIIVDDAELDLTEMVQFDFICGVRDATCHLSLSRRPGLSQLNLSGSRKSVPSALRNIGHALDDNLPWWGIFRYWVASTLLSVLFFIGCWGAIVAAAEAIDDRWSTTAELVLVLGGIALVPLMWWGVVAFGRRVFPTLEVQVPGSSTSRQQVKRAAAAVVAAFLSVVAIGQGVLWLVNNM
jgi:hypothetical protein